MKWFTSSDNVFRFACERQPMTIGLRYFDTRMFHDDIVIVQAYARSIRH